MAAEIKHITEKCNGALLAIRDTLYVLSGKWKIQLIVLLREGPMRFNELQRSLVDITPKVLSKELREMELNEFVIRRVYDTVPVTVTYELTPYAATVDPIINSLREWGTQHRERIIASRKSEVKETVEE
ncbi:transcriptional regulator [Mucilaginibacter conchicola]|uniref:Transcriptional regulator n=1 Tax=Mucilaginibacter conchicola TaxID=2303333 RepID=A0A372NWN2_9SPHI|nr:helix-turn-helix domain-containing protein [Mucilaginibacter conchicola]RFZ94523.1 transcriptional regulator [Mucilaginibacter conchicola]